MTFLKFDLGVKGLPLLEPSMRPTPLSPAEWKDRLQSLNSNADEDNSKSCVLLDVRNGIDAAVFKLCCVSLNGSL